VRFLISGSDIMEGNRVLTLALIWQMMRAYTLSLLAQVNLSCDYECLDWQPSQFINTMGKDDVAKSGK
jgi:hypothetical protein